MTKVLIVENSTQVEVKESLESKVIIMNNSTDDVKVAMAMTTI
jgi:hypothetical protein